MSSANVAYPSVFSSTIAETFTSSQYKLTSQAGVQTLQNQVENDIVNALANNTNTSFSSTVALTTAQLDNSGQIQVNNFCDQLNNPSLVLRSEYNMDSNIQNSILTSAVKWTGAGADYNGYITPAANFENTTNPAYAANIVLTITSGSNDITGTIDANDNKSVGFKLTLAANSNSLSPVDDLNNYKASLFQRNISPGSTLPTFQLSEYNVSMANPKNGISGIHTIPAVQTGSNVVKTKKYIEPADANGKISIVSGGVEAEYVHSSVNFILEQDSATIEDLESGTYKIEHLSGGTSGVTKVGTALLSVNSENVSSELATVANDLFSSAVSLNNSDTVDLIDTISAQLINSGGLEYELLVTSNSNGGYKLDSSASNIFTVNNDNLTSNVGYMKEFFGSGNAANVKHGISVVNGTTVLGNPYTGTAASSNANPAISLSSDSEYLSSGNINNGLVQVWVDDVASRVDQVTKSGAFSSSVQNVYYNSTEISNKGASNVSAMDVSRMTPIGLRYNVTPYLCIGASNSTDSYYIAGDVQSTLLSSQSVSGDVNHLAQAPSLVSFKDNTGANSDAFVDSNMVIYSVNFKPDLFGTSQMTDGTNNIPLLSRNIGLDGKAGSANPILFDNLSFSTINGSLAAGYRVLIKNKVKNDLTSLGNVNGNITIDYPSGVNFFPTINPSSQVNKANNLEYEGIYNVNLLSWLPSNKSQSAIMNFVIGLPGLNIADNLANKGVTSAFVPDPTSISLLSAVYFPAVGVNAAFTGVPTTSVLDTVKHTTQPAASSLKVPTILASSVANSNGSVVISKISPLYKINAKSIDAVLMGMGLVVKVQPVYVAIFTAVSIENGVPSYIYYPAYYSDEGVTLTAPPSSTLSIGYNDIFSMKAVLQYNSNTNASPSWVDLPSNLSNSISNYFQIDPNFSIVTSFDGYGSESKISANFAVDWSTSLVSLLNSANYYVNLSYQTYNRNNDAAGPTVDQINVSAKSITYAAMSAASDFPSNIASLIASSQGTDINNGKYSARLFANKSIYAITSQGGSNYLVAPTVTITDNDGSGSGAVINASVSGGVVSFTLANTGSGYTNPSVTVTPNTVVPVFAAVTLDANGGIVLASQPFTTNCVGYSTLVLKVTRVVGDSNSDIGNSGANKATINVLLNNNGSITSMTVTNAGKYSVGYAPFVEIASSTVASGATVSVALTTTAVGSGLGASVSDNNGLSVAIYKNTSLMYAYTMQPYTFQNVVIIANKNNLVNVLETMNPNPQDVTPYSKLVHVPASGVLSMGSLSGVQVTNISANMQLTNVLTFNVLADKAYVSLYSGSSNNLSNVNGTRLSAYNVVSNSNVTVGGSSVPDSKKVLFKYARNNLLADALLTDVSGAYTNYPIAAISTTNAGLGYNYAPSVTIAAPAGPYTVTGSAANGSSTLTLSSAQASLLKGMKVSGTGIAAGTLVSSINSELVTLSNAVTGAISGSVTFTNIQATASSSLNSDGSINLKMETYGTGYLQGSSYPVTIGAPLTTVSGFSIAGRQFTSGATDNFQLNSALFNIGTGGSGYSSVNTTVTLPPPDLQTAQLVLTCGASGQIASAEFGTSSGVNMQGSGYKNAPVNGAISNGSFNNSNGVSVSYTFDAPINYKPTPFITMGTGANYGSPQFSFTNGSGSSVDSNGNNYGGRGYFSGLPTVTLPAPIRVVAKFDYTTEGGVITAISSANPSVMRSTVSTTTTSSGIAYSGNGYSYATAITDFSNFTWTTMTKVSASGMYDAVATPTNLSSYNSNYTNTGFNIQLADPKDAPAVVNIQIKNGSVALTLLYGGAGILLTTAVTFRQGTGTMDTNTCTPTLLSGVVTSISANSQGPFYTSLDFPITPIISAPPSSSSTFSLLFQGGKLANIPVINGGNGGSGYGSLGATFTVNITHAAGDSIQATGSVSVDSKGKITGMTLSNPGAGYVSATYAAGANFTIAQNKQQTPATGVVSLTPPKVSYVNYPIVRTAGSWQFVAMPNANKVYSCPVPPKVLANNSNLTVSSLKDGINILYEGVGLGLVINSLPSLISSTLPIYPNFTYPLTVEADTYTVKYKGTSYVNTLKDYSLSATVLPFGNPAKVPQISTIGGSNTIMMSGSVTDFMVTKFFPNPISTTIKPYVVFGSIHNSNNSSYNISNGTNKSKVYFNNSLGKPTLISSWTEVGEVFDNSSIGTINYKRKGVSITSNANFSNYFTSVNTTYFQVARPQVSFTLPIGFPGQTFPYNLTNINTTFYVDAKNGGQLGLNLVNATYSPTGTGATIANITTPSYGSGFIPFVLSVPVNKLTAQLKDSTNVIETFINNMNLDGSNNDIVRIVIPANTSDNHTNTVSVTYANNKYSISYQQPTPVNLSSAFTVSGSPFNNIQFSLNTAFMRPGTYTLPMSFVTTSNLYLYGSSFKNYVKADPAYGNNTINAWAPGSALTASSYYNINNYVYQVTGVNKPTSSVAATLSNAGNVVVLAAANPSITVNMSVSGPNIAANTTVSSINGLLITLSQNTSSVISSPSTLTFTSVSQSVSTSGSVRSLAVAIGVSSLTLASSNASVVVGMSVSGTGIAAGTLVSSINGTALGLNKPTTEAYGAGSVTVLTFNSAGLSGTISSMAVSSAMTDSFGNTYTFSDYVVGAPYNVISKVPLQSDSLFGADLKSTPLKFGDSVNGVTVTNNMSLAFNGNISQLYVPILPVNLTNYNNDRVINFNDQLNAGIAALGISSSSIAKLWKSNVATSTLLNNSSAESGLPISITCLSLASFKSLVSALNVNQSQFDNVLFLNQPDVFNIVAPMGDYIYRQRACGEAIFPAIKVSANSFTGNSNYNPNMGPNNVAPTNMGPNKYFQGGVTFN